jgi:hypothetical protein
MYIYGIHFYNSLKLAPNNYQSFPALQKNMVATNLKTIVMQNQK